METLQQLFRCHWVNHHSDQHWMRCLLVACRLRVICERQAHTVYNGVKTVVWAHLGLLKPPFPRNPYLLPSFSFAYLCFRSQLCRQFSSHIFSVFESHVTEDWRRNVGKKIEKANIRVYFCSSAILWADGGITGVRSTPVTPLFSHVAGLIGENAQHAPRQSYGFVAWTHWSLPKWAETLADTRRAKVCKWETRGS